LERVDEGSLVSRRSPSQEQHTTKNVTTSRADSPLFGRDLKQWPVPLTNFSAVAEKKVGSGIGFSPSLSTNQQEICWWWKKRWGAFCLLTLSLPGSSLWPALGSRRRRDCIVNKPPFTFFNIAISFLPKRERSELLILSTITPFLIRRLHHTCTLHWWPQPLLVGRCCGPTKVSHFDHLVFMFVGNSWEEIGLAGFLYQHQAHQHCMVSRLRSTLFSLASRWGLGDGWGPALEKNNTRTIFVSLDSFSFCSFLVSKRGERMQSSVPVTIHRKMKQAYK